jgi:predicted DNA-binding ribbon-helix-helix protein
MNSTKQTDAIRSCFAMTEDYEVKRTPKRSIAINGKRTSISVENEFWDGFRRIAASRQLRLSDLASEISAAHGKPNLSSGIRVFVLSYYQNLASDQAGV